MFDHLHYTRYAPRRGERGQALLFLLAILGLATGMFVYNAVSGVSRANADAKTNARALAEAKAALIGWAVSRGTSTSTARPGELPCPDTTGLGSDSGSCAAGLLGRLPWKTLGIREPKDAAGETLWYAVAGPFRRFNASTTAITSDTMGDMTVYNGSTATNLTTQAVAVIFAAGGALGSQVRDTTTTANCPTTGTTIAKNLCAANYLESTGGANNAVNNGPFVSALASTTFNDQVLVITAADLMPLVEQRVAREMMAILENYRAATGVYPWADRSDGGSNDALNSDAWNRNRFPCGTATPTAWTGGLALPPWLTNGCDCTVTNPAQRGWACVILYAVAKNRLQNSGSGCAYSNVLCPANTLTVNNPNSRTADLCLTGVSPFKCTPTVVSSGSADLVLITPGSTTVSRTAGWPNTTFSTPITLYFEDAVNGSNNNDTFVVPSSTAYDSDRIYIVR